MKEKLEVIKLKGEIFIGRLKMIIVVLIILLEIFIIGKFIMDKNLLNLQPIGPKIAVVNFNKEVTTPYVNKIMEDIDLALENKEYKELLFIMNSPGGSPTASEELSEYLKNIKSKIKITMYIQSMAASGGYYIASSIKPLIANKNAIVGSIGVIMPHYNLGDLAKKIGIEEDDLSSGEYKKPISFFKKIDSKNKEYLTKQILTPMYNNFLNSVAKNRGVSLEKIKTVAEGKIYLANNVEIKNILIDDISSLYKVKKEITKKYKGIKFYSIIKNKSSGLFGNSNINLDLNLKGLLNNTTGEIK